MGLCVKLGYVELDNVELDESNIQNESLAWALCVGSGKRPTSESN